MERGRSIVLRVLHECLGRGPFSAATSAPTVVLGIAWLRLCLHIHSFASGRDQVFGCHKHLARGSRRLQRGILQ